MDFKRKPLQSLFIMTALLSASFGAGKSLGKIDACKEIMGVTTFLDNGPSPSIGD